MAEEHAYIALSQVEMDDQQPTFKVIDRRPFNPDGTPREVLPEELREPERADSSKFSGPASIEPEAETAQTTSQAEASTRPEPQTRPAASAPRREGESSRTAGDPLDDPTSFLSLIMSLASNAAASLGMMPHPVTGETGVDLKTAKHWIEVLGMLQEKTRGNLDSQEAQVLESLLADLRMQYVSLSSTPTPPPAKFSAGDITGGR